MFALTLQSAKQIAIVAVIVFVILALVMAKVMVGITKKFVGVIIFAALAFGVWTQRVSLQDCADNVRAAGGQTEATCHFFGSDVHIKEPLGP